MTGVLLLAAMASAQVYHCADLHMDGFVSGIGPEGLSSIFDRNPRGINVNLILSNDVAQVDWLDEGVYGEKGAQQLAKYPRSDSLSYITLPETCSPNGKSCGVMLNLAVQEDKTARVLISQMQTVLNTSNNTRYPVVKLVSGVCTRVEQPQ
jgi:hypothetical protein